MAFATSNKMSSSAGDLFRVVGDWTGNEGDTSGTLVVPGIVYSCIFQNHDADSQEDRPTPCSISRDSTTGRSTITVHNHATVTTGRFSVEYR